MRVVSLFALAAVGAVASCAAAGADLAAPAAAPLTQASAPVYAVGEQWEFAFESALDPQQNRNYTQTVESVGNGQTVMAVGSGKTVLDANGNIMRTAGGAFDTSDGKLRFPMSVGQSWSTSYVYKSGSWISHCQRDAKVVAIERVSTRAGSFDAFRIEEATSWSGNDQYGGNGVTHETDWYAPAVGRIVKLDYQSTSTKGVATTNHMELVRFAPLPAPQ